jgi:hypothetical protein
MSDYHRYTLVKDAYDRAKALGLKVKWDTTGWMIELPFRMIRGKTSEELHCYLNGIEDGMELLRREKEDE